MIENGVRSRSPVEQRPKTRKVDESKDMEGIVAVARASCGSLPNVGLGRNDEVFNQDPWQQALPPAPNPPLGPSASLNMDIEKSIAAAMDKSKEVLLGAVTVAASDAARGILAGVNSHLTSLDESVAALALSQDDLLEGHKKLESQNREILEKMEKISKQMQGMSHSASAPALPVALGGEEGGAGQRPDVTTGGFWRAPNPKVLYCNTMGKAKVDIKLFYAAIVKLAGEANVGEEHFELRGDTLDDRFEISFTSSSANAHALQFFQSLHLGRGKYKPMFVNTPTGEAVQFFVNPDKNSATIRKEILCKRLNELIDPLLPAGKKAFPRRSTGSVLVDRRVLATVVVVSEQITRITWYQPKAIELQLDTLSITEQFNVSTGSGQSS